MSINTYSLNISAFLMSKYFPIMSSMIGMHGCLSFMSGACILGMIFVIFVMEETKGRNLDSIGSGTDRPETTASAQNRSNV